MGITEHVEGDECKFAVWSGRTHASESKVSCQIEFSFPRFSPNSKLYLRLSSKPTIWTLNTCGSRRSVNLFRILISAPLKWGPLCLPWRFLGVRVATGALNITPVRDPAVTLMMPAPWMGASRTWREALWPPSGVAAPPTLRGSTGWVKMALHVARLVIV